MQMLDQLVAFTLFLLLVLNTIFKVNIHCNSLNALIQFILSLFLFSFTKQPKYITIKTWCDIACVAQNDGVDEIYKNNHPKDWMKLQNKIVTLKNILQEEPEKRPWRHDGKLCPTDIKAEAIHDLVSSIKAIMMLF